MPITNQPSPQRQSVLTFVSPNVQDLLFFETVDAQRVGKVPPAYGTAHPDKVNFPNHVLAYVKQADPNGQLYYYYYANTRESQDDYNFEYSQASLGDTKFNTVVRTYVSLRSEFKEDGVAAGDAMPTSPSAANFEGKGYILMGRDQKRLGDRELDGIFVVEQRTYFVPDSMHTLKWDDLSGRNLRISVSYLYSGQIPSGQTDTIDDLIVDPNNSYWSTVLLDDQENEGYKVASYREGRKISSDWFEVIRTETIAGASGVGTGITVDSYFTSIDHSWPPVLESVGFEVWARHDGQDEYHPTFTMNPEAYNGPCKCLVTIKYNTEPFTDVEAEAMQPQSFTFNTPYARLSVPPCLMNGSYIYASTGTQDPVYAFNYYKKEVPVTTPPSWPETLIVRDKQEQGRGGFVRTTWTVYRPSYG